MYSEGELPLAQTPPLTVKRMVATDEGLTPFPVSLSPTKRRPTTSVDTRAPLEKAWETTL